MEHLQTEVIENLAKRKKISRNYLRSLSPTEKVEKLVQLQQWYYEMLLIREQNGGRAIPEKWKKWHKARFESS
jgi:hypothetical protein